MSLESLIKQESVRKEVGGFFRVLNGCIRFLRHELHKWSDEIIALASPVCVFIYNMIVDISERGKLKVRNIKQESLTGMFKDYSGGLKLR